MNRSIYLLFLIFLLTGCASTPITDGHYAKLPEPSTRIIVWGNHPAVVETATTWLKKRGLFTLDPASMGTALEEKAVRWSHTFQDEIAVLQAAEKLGAEQVVFANRYGDHRAPSVSVRGVAAQNHQLLWIGSGRFSGFLKEPENDLLSKLTCQALATAWGYRAPGNKWFMSSIGLCMVEEEKKGGN